MNPTSLFPVAASTSFTQPYLGNSQFSVMYRVNQNTSPRVLELSTVTGLPNKVCPRLRDSACWRSGEITQPRTSLIRESCIMILINTILFYIGCYIETGRAFISYTPSSHNRISE